MQVTEVKIDGEMTYVVDTSDNGIENILPSGKPEKRDDNGAARDAIKRSEKKKNEAAQVMGSERHLYQYIAYNGGAKKVLEAFGGIGRSSMLISKYVRPERHVIMDISTDCVLSTKQSVSGAKVLHVDSFEHIKKFQTRTYGLVAADFSRFTFNRYLKNPRYRDMIDNVFRISCRWVVLTDSAIFGISRFQTNRDSYAKSIGMDPKDWKDYYRAIREKYDEIYGFELVKAIEWRRESSMLVFRKKREGRRSLFNGVETLPRKDWVDVEVGRTMTIDER